MIRPFAPHDMDAVLDVWLSASIAAHDFVAADFWQSQREAMRDIYLPSAEVHVDDDGTAVTGFSALLGDTLAALFVAPAHQGRGIGQRLMAHAQSLRQSLQLAVYTANVRSVAFYRAQGFVVASERRDAATGQPEYVMRWTRDASAGSTSRCGAA